MLVVGLDIALDGVGGAEALVADGDLDSPRQVEAAVVVISCAKSRAT